MWIATGLCFLAITASLWLLSYCGRYSNKAHYFRVNQSIDYVSLVLLNQGNGNVFSSAKHNELIVLIRRLLLLKTTVGSFGGCGLVSRSILLGQFLQFHFDLLHHGPGAVTSNRISLRLAKEAGRVRGRGRRPSSRWFHFQGPKRNSQVHEQHFKEETINSMRSNGAMLRSSCGRLSRFHSGLYLFPKLYSRQHS